MEEDIERIKREISNFARKYGIRYAVFKTTKVDFYMNDIEGVEVETELIYQGRNQ